MSYVVSLGFYLVLLTFILYCFYGWVSRKVLTMLKNKGSGLYRDRPYEKLHSYIYGGKEVNPAVVVPAGGVLAPINLPPVPVAPDPVNVSSVLGSDPFGNDIILSGKEREILLYLLGVSGAGKTTMLLNLI